MPSFDERYDALLGDGSTPPLEPPPGFEAVRPFLRPSLFNGLIPHFWEFERRLTAGLIGPINLDPPLDGFAPQQAETSSPNPAPETMPEITSYEDLRPHLTPALFEGLKPHVEEFKRRLAAGRIALGAPIPMPTAGGARDVARFGVPERSRPNALFPQDPPSAALTSLEAPTRAGPKMPASTYSPFDPSPSAPPLAGGTVLSSDLFAPSPLASTAPTSFSAGPPPEPKVSGWPSSLFDLSPPSQPLVGGMSVSSDLFNPSPLASSAPLNLSPMVPGAGPTQPNQVDSPARVPTELIRSSQNASPGFADMATNNTTAEETPPEDTTSEIGQRQGTWSTFDTPRRGVADYISRDPMFAVQKTNANGNTGAHEWTQATTVYDDSGRAQATAVEHADGTQTATLSPDATGRVIKLSNGQLQLAAAGSVAASDVVVASAGETAKTVGRWILTLGEGAGLVTGALAGLFLLLSKTSAGRRVTENIGDGSRFRLDYNPDDGRGRIEALTNGAWTQTEVVGIRRPGGIQFDPTRLSTTVGLEFARTIQALSKQPPSPVERDVVLPPAFADVPNVKQYTLDADIPAGTLGLQDDGTIGVLSYGYRGLDWFRGQPVPVVGQLTQSQVNAVCTAYNAVQNLTTSKYQAVLARSFGMSPQRIGMEVHREIAMTVKTSWPSTSFAAWHSEVGFHPSQGQLPPNSPRLPGSSWLDVLQDNHNNTYCIYEIKTGNATLKNKQAWQYLDVVKNYRTTAPQIMVIEVKP